MGARLIGPTGIVCAFILAGCLAQEGPKSDLGFAYPVKVTASHDVQGEGRTIELSLLQNGKQLGRGEYTATNSTPRSQIEVFNATVGSGTIYVSALRPTWFGSAGIVDRRVEVADCPTPIQVNAHVLDDDTQLTTNCD